MSRIYSKPGSSNPQSINKESVACFFNQRAEKISSIGPLHAVIYQEKNPVLAQKRDVAEKEKLLPLLGLNDSMRVLDVGCGTGRWASSLVPLSAYYRGIDACAGLIDHAREFFSSSSNCTFTVASANDFSLSGLDENEAFDRILCTGVLMYLNDNEVYQALKCMFSALTPGGIVMIREPLGINERLTISEHYSEELEQDYNAIYRTMPELAAMIQDATLFTIKKSGDVFDSAELNNRSETKQQWLLLERSA